MRRSRSGRKHARINIKTYFTTLGIMLAVILCGFFVLMGSGDMFSTNTEEPAEDSVIIPTDKASGKVNVLILGVDADGLRTDTIMLASYNLDENKVNILSIPRDTRVYIGNKYQKINAAHAVTKNGKIRGAQGSVEAVTLLTGIPINYYVEFSFDTFRETVDALGGVEFDVPQNMYYEDPEQGLHINLKKGTQLLDGDKAEQLVRFRRYPEGDIARVQMQQSFMKALFEQKLNASIITKIPDLYKQLSENVTTNAKLSDIIKYIPNLKELSYNNISMYQLPGKANDTDYGASYWICDKDKTKEMAEEVFGY